VTSTSSHIDKDVKEDLHGIMQYQEQTSLEIEKAIEPEFTEVVTDHQKASQILIELAKSVKSEALILLPIDKSMVRLDRLQVFDYIIEASQENNNAAVVKIICPLSQINSHIVKRISDCTHNIKIINGNNSPYGMFIVDNHKLFRAELRKPNAEDLSEAIGYTIYSTSKASANSFKSVFELLWAELILNEELKRADKMQKEFINIATHELRTPAQSILGYAELASTDPKLCKDDRHGLIDAIYRNAIRLQRLTKDILDVAKIESGTFQLNNEVFNLNNLVADVVFDIKKRIVTIQENKVSIIYKTGKGEVGDVDNADTDTIFANADKERITQVLYNLLDNAVKFSKDNSTISVIVWKQNQKYDEVNNGKGKDRPQQYQQLVEEIIVKIQDTGAGIHPDILPRLFTKFATKSLTGTGLGLYISKNIVEGHGGKLWAQNNPDGNGATFAFSLPLVKLY
jgi:two-component system, OmpR family, sensor histidine kinase VicK